MSYLEIAKSVRTESPLDGVTALSGLKPEPGTSLPHRWKGQLVESPKGQGRLEWTDGERAAVCPHGNLALMVNLADVRLAARQEAD